MIWRGRVTPAPHFPPIYFPFAIKRRGNPKNRMKIKNAIKATLEKLEFEESRLRFFREDYEVKLKGDLGYSTFIALKHLVDTESLVFKLRQQVTDLVNASKEVEA